MVYCKEPNCISIKSGKRKKAHYGYPGKPARYCSKHKKENMINSDKRNYCIEPNCISKRTGNRTTAMYGYFGYTPIYCSKHKKENMFDLRNRQCIFKNCSTKPNYNFPGNKYGLYCNEHKKKGMVDTVNKFCLVENCTTRPVYNFPGEKSGIYCFEHKLEDMINVKDTRCLTPLCDIIISNKQYKGYCSRCFRYMFPDEAITRNFKTKQLEVQQFVMENFGNFEWIFDKVIDNGCSRRRPDMFLDLGSHVIIVEIDEEQHEVYDEICENKRLMELSQDIAHRPMIMIRFNPDNYIDSSGGKVSSCWKIDKNTGKCVISNMVKWIERLDVLGNEIEKWLEFGYNIDKTVNIVHLFYDDKNGIKIRQKLENTEIDDELDNNLVNIMVNKVDLENLEKYTVNKLKDICKENRIIGYSRKNKPNLIILIKSCLENVMS